jgi:hypothetical protein
MTTSLPRGLPQPSLDFDILAARTSARLRRLRLHPTGMTNATPGHGDNRAVIGRRWFFMTMIGKPTRIYTVEPIESPVPAREPEPEPKPNPTEAPRPDLAPEPAGTRRT